MRTLRQLLLAVCISLLALSPAFSVKADQTPEQPNQPVPPTPAEQSTAGVIKPTEAPLTALKTLLDKASDLVVLRRNVEAQQLYRQVLQVEPGNSDAIAGLGWTLYDTGQYRQGEVEEKKALAINQNNFLAHHYLACMYLAKGRNQEAADEFRIEYKLAPKRRCHCGPIESVLKKYPSKN